MDRSYKIKPIHISMRLDRWIKHNIGKYPQSLLEKSIRKGKIKINKIKTKSSYKLKDGDEVNFYNFNYNYKQNKVPKFIPSKKNLHKNEKSLIENNKDFIVLNKQSGISVQGGTKSKNNLIDIFANSNLFADTKPYSVHRLDKDTSGVMIIAKNYNYAKLFTTLFRLRKIHKTYLAVVKGEFPKSIKTMEDNLEYFEKNKKIKLKAITYLKVLKTNYKYSFLELNPKTGRKHQLRKQLFIRGFPIVGDQKYNKEKKKYSKEAILLLHSYKLKYMINEQKFSFQAPFDDNFKKKLNLYFK